MKTRQNTFTRLVDCPVFVFDASRDRDALIVPVTGDNETLRHVVHVQRLHLLHQGSQNKQLRSA